MMPTFLHRCTFEAALLQPGVPYPITHHFSSVDVEP